MKKFSEHLRSNEELGLLIERPGSPIIFSNIQIQTKNHKFKKPSPIKRKREEETEDNKSAKLQ